MTDTATRYQLAVTDLCNQILDPDPIDRCQYCESTRLETHFEEWDGRDLSFEKCNDCNGIQ